MSMTGDFMGSVEVARDQDNEKTEVLMNLEKEEKC